MDKRKAIEYIIIQLESLETDLQDILTELNFSELEHSEIKKTVCYLLQGAISSLEAISNKM